MKTIVFTDADLDGSMSYLMLKWTSTNKLPYKVTTVTKFHDDFTAWSRKNKIDEYDKIFILDLDVSKSLDLIDRSNVYIIDHHKTHVANKDKYKHAKIVVQEYPSCAKLLYKLYKSKLDGSMTKDQKKLLLLVDDYDSWTHKYPQSKQLNYIFWNYQGDRLDKFLKDFAFGYKQFTVEQQKTVEFYERKLQKTVESLAYHQAILSISGAKRKCISTFASTLISDIGNYLVDTLGADIGFVINPESNRVSVRKNINCNVDLGKLSASLIDGGGHDQAAGGVCTEKFLEFSKLFKPIHNG